MMRNKDLENKLWTMANDLRGNTSFELTELKDYVLGIIFYKFISEKIEKFYKKELGDSWEDTLSKSSTEDYKTLVKESKQKIGYFIEHKNLFRTFINKIKNDEYSNEDFSRAIIDFNDSIESNEDFSNLFSNINLSSIRLGKTEKEKSHVIATIMVNIQDIESETNKFTSDVLGDVYEYLISKFASNAGKKAGEFYTPQHLSCLLAEIVTNGRKEVQDIYDPTAGSGSLLIRIASLLKRFKSINGQEKVNATYNLARMNMIIHGINFRQFRIFNGDTINDDMFKDKKFDIIVSNPPYGTKWEPSKELLNDKRFYNYGAIAPKAAMEMSFVQHMVYHLKQNGVASILLPTGVLFRAGSEKKILKYLVEKNILDSVILLPSKMFASTDIQVILMTLKKNKKVDDFFLMDATDLCEKNGKYNVITQKHREEIISLLNARKKTEISTSLSFKEIDEKDYNLNITRYIQRKKEKNIDIDVLGKGIKNNLKKLRELEKNIDLDIKNIKDLL